MLLVLVAITTATTTGVPICDNSVFSPCGCREKLTNTRLKNGVQVEFREFLCDVQHNDKTKDMWKAQGLKCVQIYNSKTLYRSQSGEPIEENISYRSSCDLRCEHLDCKGSSEVIHREEPVVPNEMSNKAFKKSGKLGLRSQKSDLETLCKNSFGSKNFCTLVVSYLN